MSEKNLDSTPETSVIEITTTETSTKRGMQKFRALSRIGLILLVVIHFITWYVIGIQVVGNIGIDSFYYGLTRGFITAGLIFWILIFISTILLGRAFCGWFCWFGGYLDLVDLGASKTKLKVPRRAPLYLSILAFVGLLIYLYFILVAFWLEQGLPGTILFKPDVPELWNGGQTVLSASLILLIYGPVLMFLFGPRSWCRYLCPIGALLKIFSILSFGKMRLANDECTGCGACNRSCDMQIDVSSELEKYGKVRSLDCIRCFKCSDACPQDAIVFRMKKTEGSISEKAKARIQNRSQKRRKRSAFDWAIVIIWSTLSITFAYISNYLVTSPIPKEVKSVMNAGMLVLVFALVWGIQKIWKKTRKEVQEPITTSSSNE